MQKTKHKPQAPALPATDYPTGINTPGSLCRLFSLLDPPLPFFLHQQLFHSYKTDEVKAELGRLEKLGKKQNRSIDCEGLRKQIELLELANNPIDGVMYLKWQFETIDAYQAELIYLLAMQGNDVAFKAFSQKGYDSFWHLKRLASAGHEGALQSLARIAIEATEVVNQHALIKAQTFEPVAAQHNYWPFLKAPHTKLCPIPQDAEAKLIRRIGLGKKTFQKNAAANKYDPENAAIRVALQLLEYVVNMHSFGKFLYRQKLADELVKNLEGISILEEAARLPDIISSSQDGKDWWKVAKQFLLESYPAIAPASNMALNTVAPTLLKLSKVKTSKARKAMILKNIKRAFETILAERTSPVSTATPAEILEKVKITSPLISKRLNW